jgi:hypothetical protein
MLIYTITAIINMIHVLVLNNSQHTCGQLLHWLQVLDLDDDGDPAGKKQKQQQQHQGSLMGNPKAGPVAYEDVSEISKVNCMLGSTAMCCHKAAQW